MTPQMRTEAGLSDKLRNEANNGAWARAAIVSLESGRAAGQNHNLKHINIKPTH